MQGITITINKSFFITTSKILFAPQRAAQLSVENMG